MKGLKNKEKPLINFFFFFFCVCVNVFRQQQWKVLKAVSLPTTLSGYDDDQTTNTSIPTVRFPNKEHWTTFSYSFPERSHKNQGATGEPAPQRLCWLSSLSRWLMTKSPPNQTRPELLTSLFPLSATSYSGSSISAYLPHSSHPIGCFWSGEILISLNKKTHTSRQLLSDSIEQR